MECLPISILQVLWYGLMSSFCSVLISWLKFSFCHKSSYGGNKQKVEIFIDSQKRHPNFHFYWTFTWKHSSRTWKSDQVCCNFMRLFGLGGSRWPRGYSLQQLTFFYWVTESKCLQPSFDLSWRCFLYYTGHFSQDLNISFGCHRQLLCVLIIVWDLCMSLWCNSWTIPPRKHYSESLNV